MRARTHKPTDKVRKAAIANEESGASNAHVATCFGNAPGDRTMCYLTSIVNATNMLQFSVRESPNDTSTGKEAGRTVLVILDSDCLDPQLHVMMATGASAPLKILEPIWTHTCSESSHTAKNFPQIMSAEDLAIWFGNSPGDGTMRNVTTIARASASSMLQFSVRVSPGYTAGDVPWRVRYVGSDEYCRSTSKRDTKEVVTAFTFLLPLPFNQSVRWCTAGAGGRTAPEVGAGTCCVLLHAQQLTFANSHDYTVNPAAIVTSCLKVINELRRAQHTRHNIRRRLWYIMCIDHYL